MEKRKVCLIGCGSIFPAHADVLNELPGVTIAAVADIRPDRASDAAAKYGCAAYKDWKAMLLEQRPDAVHICTPHWLHMPMAVYALEHGIHVLTEKPAALSPAEVSQMIKARDASGKCAGVVFQNRLNDATQAARQAVRSGRYGRILGIKGLVAWHRDDAYYRDSGWRGRFETEGGGVLMNQSIHTLDLLRYLAGDVLSLQAHTANWAHAGVIEVEDTAVAFLRFAGGATGLFYATTANAADSAVEIEITLENATVLIRDERALLCAHGENKVLSVNGQNADPLCKPCWGSGHARLISGFYRALDAAASGRAAEPDDLVSLEEGRAALRIIGAIYRSSRSGKEEPVS